MRGLLLSSWRNFIRNLRRYRILLIALVLVSIVLTAVLATVLGMRDALHGKASRYFAGDLVVYGFDGSGDSLITEPEAIWMAFEDFRESELGVKAVSSRSTYYDTEHTELFFSGYWIKQRRLVGVEWDKERPILDDFDFVSGGLPEMDDESAVLISSATARSLQIDVGDELLVSIKTEGGATNTGEFVVRGIFAEYSFFGFTSYVHRRALNRLKRVPPERVNEMGIYLENPFGAERRGARLLANKLAEAVPVFGVIESRDDYIREMGRERGRRHYGVITISAQLQEISDLLQALSLVAGAVILMFLAIVVVGVGNTFAMIVWERTREVGTLRALGMQRGGTVLSFVMEAAFLGLGSVIIGLLAGAAVLEAVREFVQFPSNVVTTLVFTQGKLRWLLPAPAAAGIALLVVASCVGGSLRAALRAGRLRPVDALRGDR